MLVVAGARFKEKDYTIDEVAAELQVHRKTVERLIARGSLVAYRVRTHYRITPEALRAYKKSHEVKREDVVEV